MERDTQLANKYYEAFQKDTGIALDIGQTALSGYICVIERIIELIKNSKDMGYLVAVYSFAAAYPDTSKKDPYYCSDNTY